MGKTISKLLVLGLTMAIGIIPAKSQTSIMLIDSGSSMLNFTATGTGGLSADLGNCGLTACSFSGSASGSISDNPVTGYSLSVSGPLFLGNAGDGTFNVNDDLTHHAFAGSSLMINGAGGATLFTGTLTSLSVYQSPASTNGQAQISITATGTGGSVLLTGTIGLYGANLTNLAGFNRGGISAPIVPEPASMILFGSGLILLGGVLRRRKAQIDRAPRTDQGPVTPLSAGLVS